MSRGFVKEADQEELPLIPPRAPLPAGVTNYVTPAGLRALRDEFAGLKEQKEALPTTNEDEHRRASTVLEGKMALLAERVRSARVIDPASQTPDEVRFGATVELKQDGRPVSFQIVGVDEADVKANKLAFTAPIVQAVMGLYEGETARFDLGGEARRLEVVSITY